MYFFCLWMKIGVVFLVVKHYKLDPAGASGDAPEAKKPRLATNGQLESNLGRLGSGMEQPRASTNGYSVEHNEYLKSRPKRQVLLTVSAYHPFKDFVR